MFFNASPRPNLRKETKWLGNVGTGMKINSGPFLFKTRFPSSDLVFGVPSSQNAAFVSRAVLDVSLVCLPQAWRKEPEKNSSSCCQLCKAGRASQMSGTSETSKGLLLNQLTFHYTYPSTNRQQILFALFLPLCPRPVESPAL